MSNKKAVHKNKRKKIIFAFLYLIIAAIAVGVGLNYLPKKTENKAEAQTVVAPKKVIDVLVLHSTKAKAAATQSTLRDMGAIVMRDVRDANLALHFSKTNLQLELLGIQQVSYVEGSTANEANSILQGMMNKYDAVIPEAQTVRDALGADLVIFYANTPTSAACGKSQLRTNSNTAYYDQYAYMVINVEPSSCTNRSTAYTLAHELGHMVGMFDTGMPLDGRQVANDVIPFQGTNIIEMIATNFNKRTVRLYSNPDLTVEGIRFGTSGVSNAVRLLNLYGPSMSDYRSRAANKSKTVFFTNTPTVEIYPGKTSVVLSGYYDSPLKPAIVQYALNWNHTTNSFPALPTSIDTTVFPNAYKWTVTVPTAQISGNSLKLTGIINGRACELNIDVKRLSQAPGSSNSVVGYPGSTQNTPADCSNW